MKRPKSLKNPTNSWFQEWSFQTFLILELCGTCLHSASESGHLQIVQYLVETGADIEAKVKNQQTPLHMTCENGHLSIVQYQQTPFEQ